MRTATVKASAANAGPIRASLLASIQRDRWIAYPAGTAGLRRLGELLATRPRVRMPCLLIYGVSGAGKSMLLEKFRRDYVANRPTRNGLRPIVATQMPPLPILRSLYAEIVRTLGGPTRPGMRFYEMEETALGLLRQANPRMLIVDEIQHLLSCSNREQRAALNMIKYLSNEQRISIIAAGTHEALHVMRYDPQIASRFEQMELPVWSESNELRRFVAGYLALLPVTCQPDLIDQRFIEYLLLLTDGVTGRVIDLLRGAAIQTLAQKSKTLTLEHLMSAGAALPTIINQQTPFTTLDTFKSHK
jgi:Cdc6-like AAA superfamily ATPase